MRSKDIPNPTQCNIAQKISNAAKAGDANAFENGLQELFLNIHDEIVAEANQSQNIVDSDMISKRGLRQLTGDELKFYNNLIEAVRLKDSGNPMMALSDVDKTFPQTVVSEAMEDMKQAHPLLDAVDTISAIGTIKFLMNTDAGDNAVWGELESAITKEIASGFAEIDLGQFKLSAWMPISLDMIDLGPKWLDSYIRTCLSEALAIGFETGIVTGTGKNMPIGMDRQVGPGVVVTGGVYPQKSAIAVTDFDRATYGGLVARLAKTQYNKPRDVRDLILIVNPLDYFSIIMPATTIMTPDGRFVNDVLPVPTKVIRSVAVTQGEAILGMGKKYFLGVGGKRSIQFSDDYKFLEDKRYYKVVAYANGQPKDNNAFLRLDISNLSPTYLEVKEVNFQ